MFLRNNRKLNGAPQPEQTMSEDASAQAAQEVLSTNFDVANTPPKRTFMPQLPDPEATNAWRVRNFEDSDWPAPYESNIPRGVKSANVPGPGETNDNLRPMGKKGGKKK